MSQNSVLEALYKKYQEAKEKAEYTRIVMQSDWIECAKARERMNQAYKRMEQNDARTYTIRKQYHNLRNCNYYRIDALRHKAKYVNNTDDIEAEIEELLQEVREAKAEVERRTTKNYKIALYKAEDAFEKAKDRYEQSMTEYERLKSLSDQYKAAYDQAKVEYDNKTNQPPN